MILQNQRLLAEICDNTGALVRLMDKRSGMEFVNVLPETACRVVARYERNGQLTGDTTFQPEDASVQPLENGAALCWNMAQGITVYASIALEEDGLSFRSYADCGPKTQLQLVEYPVIGGMDDWNGAEMIHSFATGLRVKEPLKHFKPGEGVRYAPYPECFSGASMQFYAYYAPGRGGLLFMAEDGESHQKWLNLYRNGDSMEATMMYGFEEMGMGKSFRADYSFKVRLLQGDGWSEPASLYKQWAVRQPWCSMGRLNDREHCEWLLKKVGLSTFGVCAGQDRSNYIRRYHKDTNTSVFHVLGPDWAHTTQSFSGHNPGYSLDGWVPTNFRQANLEAIREVGDYFAPFEFDLFGRARAEESDEIKRKAEANRQLFPEKGHTYSCDAYDFFMMCPCEEHTHDMHVARDKQIVAESGANAMYYDISANNLLHVCLKEDHHHPKGGGNELTKAYRRIYRDTKEACAEAKNDRYFPVGTEMINEVFLPELDFYQARAGAQPCSALEMWPYKSLLNEGIAELIPLFAFVYHEYGAVRMDGWGKVVEEVGDLFYDNVAKIYLWGGLYEINHEYSPGEAFDGKETRPEDHYYNWQRSFGYEYAPGRARYIGQFANLRTGAGNPYLAYGEMMPPPAIDVPQRDKHYYHYNHGPQAIFSGDIQLPAVRASAWKRTDGKVGYAIFLTNTELDEQRVKLQLNAADFLGAEKVVLRTGFGNGEPQETRMGSLKDETLTLTLKLPARTPVMLEIL